MKQYLCCRQHWPGLHRARLGDIRCCWLSDPTYLLLIAGGHQCSAGAEGGGLLSGDNQGVPGSATHWQSEQTGNL